MNMPPLPKKHTQMACPTKIKTQRLYFFHSAVLPSSPCALDILTCEWNPGIPEHWFVLPMTLGWIISYSWAVFRVSVLASTWWKLTEFSQLTKDMKVTPQRIYELEFKISEPKAPALAPGLFPQAHLPSSSRWKLTRSVSQASLGALLSSLLPVLLFFYWSLLNSNKWFEESVINKSRWPLTFFLLQSYLL